jgi:RNA polymerase sigma factor (TIGR02999 family)
MDRYSEESQQVTQVLRELHDRPELFKERLFPILYQVMKQMARRHLQGEQNARTMQPTALVHEVYVRMVGADKDWQNRAHFLGCASNAMRQILIDYARKRSSAKRGSGAVKVPLGGDEVAQRALPLDTILAINEAMNRLKEFDPLKEELLQLKFFGGLTNAEAAKVAGVSLTTAKEHLRAAEAWMNRELSGSAPR